MVCSVKIAADLTNVSGPLEKKPKAGNLDKGKSLQILRGKGDTNKILFHFCAFTLAHLKRQKRKNPIREGCEEKKPEKMWSFAKLGGGGVSDGSKMPNCYFGKVFFQLACRIILGPPKHVLHLV